MRRRPWGADGFGNGFHLAYTWTYEYENARVNTGGGGILNVSLNRTFKISGDGGGIGYGGYDTSDGDAGVYSPNEKVSLVTWEYTEEKESE